MAIESNFDDEIFFASNDWPDMPMTVIDDADPPQPINITGWTFTFTVFAEDDVTPLFTKTSVASGTGIEIISAAIGTLYVHGPTRTETAAFDKPRKARWTIQSFDAADKKREVGHGLIPVGA